MSDDAGRPNIVVLGASAGGVEALRSLVAQLPRDFGAALLVVLHVGARRSSLPHILARAGPLPAAFAQDGEPIMPGRMHVAPPDYHLLVAPGGERLALSRGPAENRTRPAIDPLFRSAAHACGPRVIGVVLSGALSDGTAGLAEIARAGGVTVVQAPEEAGCADMPRSALRHVPVQHTLPAAGIAQLLARLCGQPPATSAPRRAVPARQSVPGQEDRPTMSLDHALNRPTALTCPSCGGAIRQSAVNSLPYFECHIGHRFAAQNFDDAQFHQLEQALEIALRMLNERTEMSRRLAEAARGRGQPLSAEHWERAMQEAHQRAEVLRRFIEQDWERPSDDDDEGGLPRMPETG
jgi:two-component system chemotaxis response regulator CheB